MKAEPLPELMTTDDLRRLERTMTLRITIAVVGWGALLFLLLRFT